MNFEPPKGTRDWYGPDALAREEVRSVLKGIYRKYGFEPIETPPYENLSTITFKGGGEIQKEIFRFQDQGARPLALRFDQTVPLARFLATHPDVKLPFKRYVIGESYRDGPSQPDQGRYRVFTQCDVDIIGVKSMAAEAELISLASDVFAALDLGAVEVRINNRKLLDGVLDYVGVPQDSRTAAIVALDKLDKKGVAGVREELLALTRDGEDGHSGAGQRALSEQMADALLGMTSACTGDVLGALKPVITSERGMQGIAELESLLSYAQAQGCSAVTVDPSLARGLDYYTGTTLEIFLKDKQVCKSAIGGGGRYDNMIGDFLGGQQQVPAVGFSFGLERVMMAVMAKGAKSARTWTQVYVVPVGTGPYCSAIVKQLRDEGICAEMDLEGKKLSWNMRHADVKGYPLVAIIGDSEVANGNVTLKDMTAGNQTTIPVGELARAVRNNGVRSTIGIDALAAG